MTADIFSNSVNDILDKIFLVAHTWNAFKNRTPVRMRSWEFYETLHCLNVKSHLKLYLKLLFRFTYVGTAQL